ARIDAERDADVVHLLRREQLGGVHLPRVQDLAAQRHDRLRLAIACLLRGPAGRVALDEEELRLARLLDRAVRELARQRRARDDPLAHDLLGLLETALRVFDRERRLGEPVAVADRLREVLLESAGVDPALLLLRLLDLERERKARAEHGLRAQQVLELRQRELRAVEVLRIRPKAQGRAGVVLADLADDLELPAALAVGEAHVVFLAIAADPNLEVLR